MIKNIVFDQGRVLVTYEPKEYLLKLGYDASTAEELCENIFRSSDWLALDRGDFTHGEAIERFAQRLPKYAEDIREFLGASYLEEYQIIEPCVAYLKELKQRGYGIYILSNFAPEGYEYVRQKFDYFHYIDGDVISGDVHLLKPDERIYQTLFEKYSLSPQECVFIDDSETNIKAGEALGMHGIVHTTTEATRARLEPML